jgi:acid phosphatase type 7
MYSMQQSPVLRMKTIHLSTIALLFAAAILAGPLVSRQGPAFRVDDSKLQNPPTLIAYGDQRFTDPANVKSTNPRVRQWLVERIAKEKPDAVVLNGDVPLAGSVKHDYEVFHSETRPWRDAGLRVYPALGNHEFHGDAVLCLENWWSAFPEMRNRRWYSVQLGSRIYLIALDSTMPLTPGSEQAEWLDRQVKALSPRVDVVLITMHHPPVADVQTRIEVSHNPRPNEIALRDYLSGAAKASGPRFIVSAGHIHNYERREVDGVVYLVSGGGGAKPYQVERTPGDLYRKTGFPNYHFVKFTVKKDRVQGQMFRVADPQAARLSVEESDRFEIPLKAANVGE